MLITHVESHASAVSLLESREQRYIKAIKNNNNNNVIGTWFPMAMKVRAGASAVALEAVPVVPSWTVHSATGTV